MAGENICECSLFISGFMVYPVSSPPSSTAHSIPSISFQILYVISYLDPSKVYSVLFSIHFSRKIGGRNIFIQKGISCYDYLHFCTVFQDIRLLGLKGICFLHLYRRLWSLTIMCFLHYLSIINLPLFSTVVPSSIFMFLSCRPFNVITTLSTGLVGVEVTSVSWLGQLTVGV